MSSTKLVMVIDLARCTGCESCTVACQAENSIPMDGRMWNVVFQYEVEGTGTELKMYTQPRPCMQCDTPSCARVCPVEATRIDKRNGIVTIDYGRCIGCRYCMVACPYNARVFNWGSSRKEIYDNPLVPKRPRGIVEKCTFCSHKTVDQNGEATGVLPECVTTCIGGARKFGNLEGDTESDVEVQRIIGTRNDIFRLKEELGNHPKVFYLPP
ncbi:MAG: 4Fe-4S dicluster domain-containing protein [Candidatus Hodarchaeales archaeon]|jgi:molybdopterin-containing oxidoreductase family iron-sulfur binding subunit